MHAKEWTRDLCCTARRKHEVLGYYCGRCGAIYEGKTEASRIAATNCCTSPKRHTGPKAP